MRRESQVRFRESVVVKFCCATRPPVERFFRSLKYEFLNFEKLTSKGVAKMSIVDYITFYNGQRIHSALNYKTPLTFEQEFYRKTA